MDIFFSSLLKRLSQCCDSGWMRSRHDNDFNTTVKLIIITVGVYYFVMYSYGENYVGTRTHPHPQHVIQRRATYPPGRLSFALFLAVPRANPLSETDHFLIRSSGGNVLFVRGADERGRRKVVKCTRVADRVVVI